MKSCIYVVEVKFEELPTFMPTVGVKLTREAARKELKDWKARIEGAEFRLMKYIAWKGVR